MLRLLILLIALGAGGTAAFLISRQPVQVEARPAEEATAPEIELTNILIAKSPIQRGEQISAEQLEWQTWPRLAVLSDFTEQTGDASINSIVGKFAIRSLAVGQPLQDSFLSENVTGYLPALLEAGKRAVAIQISAQTTAGGFILPNNLVDVLHTAQHPQGTKVNGQELVTTTIITNVRVLAIDQTSQDPEQDAVIGKTATLELTPEQAERVITAQASGSLSLALRPLTEPLKTELTTRKKFDQLKQENNNKPEASETLKIFRPTGAEIVTVN